MRGKKSDSPDGSLLFPFALALCKNRLKKRAPRKPETNKARHCGDQRHIVETPRIVPSEINLHIDQVGGQRVTRGGEEKDAVDRTPDTAFPEKRNARGHGKQLISNCVCHVERKVVDPQVAREQPVGVNKESKEVKRVEDQNGEIEQTKWTEAGIVLSVGLQGSRCDQGNQAHE